MTIFRRMFHTLLIITIGIMAGSCERDKSPTTPSALRDLFSTISAVSCVHPDFCGETLAPFVKRVRFVTVNFDLFQANAPRYRLNLFPDAVFQAVRKRSEINASGSISWIGHLDGIEYSDVTLIVQDRLMDGGITLPNATYGIQRVQEGVHVIYEVNHTGFPPEAPPVEVPVAKRE